MTLTIQDLGALGELLGAVAVLATLIYLALQTRQNTIAIAAQIDAAAIASNQSILLSAATSSELAEALREDSTGDVTTNEVRLAWYWWSVLSSFQWQLHQARRGLLPTFNEAGIATSIRNIFTESRSVEGSWDRTKASYPPEFVEWVEEQRSKAA